MIRSFQLNRPIQTDLEDHLFGSVRPRRHCSCIYWFWPSGDKATLQIAPCFWRPLNFELAILESQFLRIQQYDKAIGILGQFHELY